MTHQLVSVSARLEDDSQGKMLQYHAEVFSLRTTNQMLSRDRIVPRFAGQNAGSRTSLHPKLNPDNVVEIR